MATFRSGVKILSQVSKRQGYRSFQLRSYSDDRRTTFHRSRSPFWTTNNSKTPLQTSKSWFSLFHRKKSPENKLLTHESGCDLKETCQSESTKNESWLSFLKKKVSKDNRPPLTCCRMHQARLRKEEEQKALQEGREPEGWKSDVEIVTKESNAPVMCKTPTEPQPQPPPQPPPPRAVEVLKENVEKLSSKTDMAISSKSFNTRQPYEEFKIPIQSAPPPPVSGENLQPRKQSPYTTGDKFREGTNFQQCKKFHKQSNLETGSLTKIKSKHLHKSTIAQRKGKTTGVLKPAKVLNNKTLNILHTSSLLKEVKTSSKIIIPTKIQNTNSPQVLVNEIKAIKPTNISNKTLAPNKDHDSSKNLASEPPLQNVPNTATSGQVIHLDVINEKNKTQLQSDLLEVKLKLDNEVIQSKVCTRTKERKPTTKLSSKITQRRNNLKISTIRQAVNKDNCMHSNIKNKEVNSGIKDNPTLTNKYLNLGLNRSGERSTQKSVPSSIKSSCSSSKKDNKCTQEFSPSKNETRSIKSSTNLNNITNNTASSKITSSHSLPNINKNSKHNEERTSLKKAGRSIKTSSTPNNKPKPVEKLSKTNIKSETSTKVKTKEGCEQIKTDNTKSIRPNDESFISAWKENYSYVSFPRKARIPKKKENLKLTQKGNEDVYQLSLPSNIQPFVRLGEGVHLWSTPDPVQVQSPHNQKQTIKSVRKAPKLPTEEKEPWFTECQTNYVDTDFPEKRYSISKSGTNMRKSNNGLIGNKFTQDEYPKPSYAKILKYGNRNVLNSKLNNKAKSQKEKFLSSYFSFGVVNDDLNPKVKRKDEDVKQGRFVESKLVGTNYRKDQHIKQKSHSEITNYLKDTKEIKSHKQDEISIDDSVYISDMSVPIPCQSQMEESSMNDQYGSLLYAKDNFGDDFNSAKTRDKSNYYRQPYEHDKNMDASLSNIHCKNLMTDSSIQPPHSNHRNLTNDSLPDMKSPNVTEKHIPFSYEKSYGHWSILESDPTDEQQVDPHIENVIVTLPKPCSSGACLTNSRQFPNKMVKQTFSSYVGSSSCNQSCMSHNQEMEQLVHKHIKKSKYNMLANPEMSFKKNKQYIKNKRQKITGDNVKYYDCVNAETLKLKNGLSKTPMSYTKQNVIVQQFLPNRRYYSSYTSNKTSSLCKVLNRIITQNNEYLKYTGKNLLSTVPSKTIQRSPKHARKNQNTSSQAAANHAPKYFSKGQGNYSLLQKIHSDSEIHTLRRNDFNNKQAKQFTTENPVKQNPPLPSFAEYIEDPKTETKNIGNEEKVKNKFLESKNVKTLNINNTKNQQIQLSSPRENHKEKKQKTEEDLIQGNFSNDKEDKLGMLTFTKLPIKCSATQYLIGQQDQLMHSQSSFKLNSLQPPTIQYNNAPQYARHASSYSYIKPFNYGNKSKMLCSSSKDSKSEPPSCGKVDSGVKKEKSKKSCNKVTAPGCKAPKSVDCVIIKELPPCKKVCAPKKSYSECIREQTPPRPFTECLIRKPDICPGQKPVEKSYDGCAKKKKEIECPEPVIEKPIKPKKKVRDVCDPKEECDDVEPFKFKSGYSRPPMKCSSKNPSMSQPNLPPVRSYSNLKTVLPEKPKIPTRSSSYINFQIKNLKEREYSSTEKTVPESKLFEFEAKSSTRDPEPAQTFRRSSIRSYETSMSPDKISLKKDDQIVGSLKQSSLKIQSTHGNILKRKKEVKPQTNPLVLREDQYVKISLRHPETSPQKKKTISDTPFNLSTEPCLGQKHEKVLRKTSAVYPGYSALSITKNKRDKEKKFTKNPTDTSTLSNILSTYSESAKKYSTSKVQDDQNLSKAYNIPEFFSSKTVLTMINFPPPTIKMKKDTINNKKLKVPVTLKTSSINVTGNLSSTKRKSKIKSRTSLSKNFSPSSKTIKNNSTNNKFMSSVHSNDVKISVSFSKQNTNKKHCQENVIPIKDFLYKTSKNKDSNLNKIQVHSSLSNLPITVKNNVSSTILNYKLEACNVNSSPKINSLRNEPLMKFQTSTLKWNNETNQSKNQTKTSTINNYVISRKHDFDSTASTSMIRHEALQSSKIICETARNKEGTKENDENISSNLSNPSEELADLSNKTDYIVTTNRDGNVEDLFTTIKSWFSFLKTKEGLPQSDNKITENQIVVSPCETNHVNELPSESLLENTRERQCGSDISNSLQSGKTGYECKDFSSPEPFISEYAKSHSLAECYPENLANEADATIIKPSACEMYFTKNKKVVKTKLHTSSMTTNHQENIILEGGRKSMLPTKLAKHQNSKIVTPEKLRMAHERSELPTSAETYPSNGKINIFSELLNKKSTLQEWQEEYPKHINPQFDMKTHSKLNEAINKFTKVNNHVQDKIQAAYEDKVFSSGNTTETLNQESISGPLKIDKEIVVMKQNEKIQELESDKPTFFHNDNLQLSKMSNSISPSNKELGCTIKDKNASPHPFVKIRPNNCSIHSREVTFKVKGINHTRAKKVIKAHNRLSKRKNKHIPFKQAKSNRHQSENSANTDTPKYSFDAYKEINIKTKESPATSNSYVALINKFPDIMGRNIGNNSFSDIWSCHQKELPVNFILKVQDPIYPKANPKLDLKVLKPVSHDVEAECKEIEDHQSQSSNKVSQRKNMAKECSSVKTNPGSNTVKYVLPCLGLHNRPCKILLNTFNLFPLCSCYDKYKQFLMVPSLVHISPRHKSMIPKRGSDELCTEKSDAKNNSSGSGTPNETCKKNNKLGYVECEEPPKKEKPTCEKETRPKDVCPPIKRPIKMPCEKKETKKDVVKIEVNIEKEVKYEVKQEKKEPLTKEEIEARKKSFQVTKISPIKDPPPLPSCDSIAAKEVSIEILKPPNGEKPPPKSCEEESSSDICSKQCNGEGSPTVTNPPSNPCNDGGGGGKTS